ncbi:MAG: peptidoglycan-binding protein [Solirubrobacteraceae bacterium]
MAIAVLVVLSALPAVAQAAAFGSRTLANGASGEDVRVLQDLLTKAGYATTVDGEFGQGTKRSVKAWERGTDRPPNGRVAPDEARALRAQAAPAQEPVEEDVIRDKKKAEKAANPGATGGAGYVRTTKATLNPDGTAVAPANAPQEVKDIIAAGNRIHDKPYRYGGGHGKWKDTGYDCSGTVSFALHGADLLDSPLDSGSFMSWESQGPGQWVTIYANAGHMYMLVAGLRFDTSAAKESGSRWSEEMRDPAGYTVRHPPGL